MAKNLDLDAVARNAAPRTVTIGGKGYTMAFRSFGALRRFDAAQRAVAEAKTVGEQAEAVLKSLRVIVPDLHEDALEAVDLEGQFGQQLATHWSGQDDDEAEKILDADPPLPG